MSEAPDANLRDAQRWLTQATTNLDGARWLGRGCLWAQACFFCQQAAETALKAVLVSIGEREFRTHSTARLVKQVLAYQPEFADFSQDAPLLDRHYVGTRYPNGVGDQSELWEEKDFRHAEGAAAKIVELARQAIGTGPSGAP